MKTVDTDDIFNKKNGKIALCTLILMCCLHFLGDGNNPNTTTPSEDDLFSVDTLTIQVNFDNYPSGVYRLNKSSSNNIMELEKIKSAIFDYLKKNPSQKIRVEVIGYADIEPVKPNVKYQGDFGDDVTIQYKYYNTSDPLSKSFIKGKTEIENPDIALLRAYDIVDFFENNFQSNINNIHIDIAILSGRGPEYRGVIVKVSSETIVYKPEEQQRTNLHNRR